MPPRGSHFRSSISHLNLHVLIVLHVHSSLFTYLSLRLLHADPAALASAMAEGDSSANTGPAGLGKAQGAAWKYDSSDIKQGCRSKRRLEYQLIVDREALLVLHGSDV